MRLGLWIGLDCDVSMIDPRLHSDLIWLSQSAAVPSRLPANAAGDNESWKNMLGDYQPVMQQLQTLLYLENRYVCQQFSAIGHHLYCTT